MRNFLKAFWSNSFFLIFGIGMVFLGFLLCYVNDLRSLPDIMFYMIGLMYVACGGYVIGKVIVNFK